MGMRVPRFKIGDGWMFEAYVKDGKTAGCMYREDNYGAFEIMLPFICDKLSLPELEKIIEINKIIVEGESHKP